MKILICDDETYIRKNILKILTPLVTQYPFLGGDYHAIKF